jgi:hypothetical protein
MKYLAVALVTFATAASGAALAQGSDARGFDQPNSPVMSTPARDAAIHDCSVRAGKYSMSAWQSTQIDVYGECMAEHNQPG